MYFGKVPLGRVACHTEITIRKNENNNKKKTMQNLKMRRACEIQSPAGKHTYINMEHF